MSEKMRLEDILVEASSSEVTSDEIFDEAAWASTISLPDSDVVRIEEQVPVSWNGVSSCDHTDRIQAEVNAAFRRWIERKLYEHRDWRYLRAGGKPGQVRCGSHKDPWTGKRSCGCRGALPFWIEFAKP